MKLKDYLYKNVRITDTKGCFFEGYVSEFFRGEDNENGIDSIGLSKDANHLGGIEISAKDIKTLRLI